MGLYDCLAPEKSILYLPLASQYVDGGIRYTQNLGRAFNTDGRIYVGDGTTANTFPAQWQPRGAWYTLGTNSLDTRMVNPVSVDQPYTVFFLVSVLTNLLSAYCIADNVSGAVGFTLYIGAPYLSLGHFGATSGTLYVADTTFTTDSPTTYSRRLVSGACSYAGDNNGANVKMYRNGQPRTTTVILNSCVGGFASAENFLVGRRPNGVTALGSTPNVLLGFALFPYVLSGAAVRELDYRMREHSKVL